MTTRTFRIYGRTYRYTDCPEASIPERVRFDTPRQFQGQIVECAFGGFSRAEHDVGDQFLRVTDQSDRSVTFYSLEPETEPGGR